jgi:hypothetical protein
MDANKIHKEANKIRKKIEKEESEMKSEVKKVFTPHSHDSFVVFNAIYPYRTPFIWIALIMVLGIMAGTLFFIDSSWEWTLPVLFFAVGGLLTLALIRILGARIFYAAYKGWENKLGFDLYGWNVLGTVPNFPAIFHWWDVEVELVLDPACTELSKTLLQDLMLLFSKKANAAYYTADNVQPKALGDSRKSWKLKSGTVLMGSVNSIVLGKLYVFIQKSLSACQRQYGGIKEVRIHYHGTLYEVVPMSSD